MLDPPKVTAETSAADGFALMLETTCRDFEILSALVRNDFSIAAADQFLAMRARGAIRMALAKSFVSYAARAFRICEHGAQNLNVPSYERKAFLAAMRPIMVFEMSTNTVSIRKGPLVAARLHDLQCISMMLTMSY